MAVFYTDFLNGNDTTGDGSWANPYKTLYRGSQDISADGDEVRVVGSGWTDLPGTVNFSWNNSTATTSEDLTSYFPELTSTVGNSKVIITVDDEFGFYKSVLTVVAVTTTTITFAHQWGFSAGAKSIKRLTTQHYYATSAPISPLGITGTFESVDLAKVTGFNNIKISGGWTAENVQNDTDATALVVAYSGATATTGQFLNQQNLNGFNSNPENLHFSNFIFANVNFFNSNNNNHTVDQLWFIQSNLFATSNTNIYGPASGNAARLYAYNCRLNGTWQVFTTNFNIKWKIWHSHYNFGNGNVGTLLGGSASQSKIIEQYHFRFYSTTNFFVNRFWNIGGIYNNPGNPTIDEFHAYAYNSTPVALPVISGVSVSPIWLKRFYGYGRAGLNLPLPSETMMAIVGDGTQTLEELRIWNLNEGPARIESSNRNWLVKTSSGNYRAYGPELQGGNNTRAYVVRENTTEFVTGSNSLEVKSPATSDIYGTVGSTIPIASLPVFNDSRTLTIKAKANAVLPSEWLRFALYDSNGTFIQNLDLTGLSTSWQDFVYTIDLSAVTLPPNSTFLQLYAASNRNTDIAFNDNSLFIDSITLV